MRRAWVYIIGLAIVVALSTLLVIETYMQISEIQSKLLEIQSQISEIRNQHLKTFCSAWEYYTSDWYTAINSPVLSSYDYGAPNSSLLPHANLGVTISNNNSESLFNVAVEVSYRTSEGSWNTTARTDIGFLDIQQSKQTFVLLTNPYLSLWHTKRPKYGGTTTWENVTVYFLNATYFQIAAYGFSKP